MLISLIYFIQFLPFCILVYVSIYMYTIHLFILLFIILAPRAAPVVWHIFHHFSITFEHRFCIYCSWILGWIWILFLMFFEYLVRSRTQPAKPSQTIVFTMNKKGFAIQRTMIVDDFPKFSATYFVIDFG